MISSYLIVLWQNLVYTEIRKLVPKCFFRRLYRHPSASIQRIYHNSLLSAFCNSFLQTIFEICFVLKLWYLSRCNDWNVSDVQIVKFAPKCFLRQQYFHQVLLYKEGNISLWYTPSVQSHPLNTTILCTHYVHNHGLYTIIPCTQSRSVHHNSLYTITVLSQSTISMHPSSNIQRRYHNSLLSAFYNYFLPALFEIWFVLKIWYISRCKDRNVSDDQIVKFAPKCFLRQQYLHLSPTLQRGKYITLVYIFRCYYVLNAFLEIL